MIALGIECNISERNISDEVISNSLKNTRG